MTNLDTGATPATFPDKARFFVCTKCHWHGLHIGGVCQRCNPMPPATPEGDAISRGAQIAHHTERKDAAKAEAKRYKALGDEASAADCLLEAVLHSDEIRRLEGEAISRAATPAAKWREEGQLDPHGNRYDCERATLALGDLTDDEIADAVFMFGDTPPPMSEVMAGRAKMPIAYLTAAKDRIRWLSRKLVENITANAPQVDAISRDAGAYGAVSCAFWLIEQFSPFGRLSAGVSDDPEIVLGPLVLSNGEAIQCSMTCHEDMTWSFYIEIGGKPFSGEHPRWQFPEDLAAALRSLPPQDGEGEIAELQGQIENPWQQVLRLRACLWSIAHAAGVETKEDLMQAALQALPRPLRLGAALTAQPVAQEPVAFRMVPTEPTPEMIGAWYRYKNGHHYHDEPAPTDRSDYGAYRAMLFAAPAHPATPAPVEAGLREVERLIEDLAVVRGNMKLHENSLHRGRQEGEQAGYSHALAIVRNALRAQSAPVGEKPVTVGVDLASGPDQTAVTLINPTQAALDVLAERQRQISAEGWTPEHDDQYGTGEMAGAAACYALTGVKHWAAAQAPGILWPWAKSWWKPTTTRRDLVKAGALILAEMERLDRAAPVGGEVKG